MDEPSARNLEYLGAPLYEELVAEAYEALAAPFGIVIPTFAALWQQAAPQDIQTDES